MDWSNRSGDHGEQGGDAMTPTQFTMLATSAAPLAVTASQLNVCGSHPNACCTAGVDHSLQ